MNESQSKLLKRKQTMSSQVSQALKKQQSILRSIDSLDAAEESGLDDIQSEGSRDESEEMSKTPSEVSKVSSEHDLDSSCDEYGWKKETEQDQEPEQKIAQE